MELNQSARWQRWAPTLAVLAVLFLVAGALAWLLGGPGQQFGLVRDITLVAGVILLVIYILLRPGDLARLWGQRQVRYGTNVAVQIIAFVIILAIINYFTLPISDNLKLNKRWDLTATGELTLAQPTIDLLKSLKQPVKAYGFFTPQSSSLRQSADDLLKQYAYYGGSNFSYQLIDPVSNPEQAIQFKVTHDATIILVQGDRQQVANTTDESGITTALTKLVRPKQPVVYFVQGHGEADLNSTDAQGLSTVKQSLESNGYQVRPLVITTTLPSDAALLVLARPNGPLSISETQVISGYLGTGGALLFMQEPDLVLQQTGGQPWGGPFSDYLTKTWGLAFNNDILVDSQAANQNGLYIIVAQYGSSPITERLGNVASLFPVSRSIKIRPPGGNFTDVTTTQLAQTTPNSWSLPNLEQQDLSKFPRGPFNLAVSAENSRTRARLALFGDLDFATNRVVANPGIRTANLTLLLNTVNWLTRQEELVSIPPKQPVQRALRPVSSQTQTLVGLVTVVGLPLVAVALGVSVWWRRRNP